jgi:hypothetical protein
LTTSQKGDIMDRLKIEHHIKHLQEMHDGLDNDIKEEEKHYGNDALVTLLKKKKLKLKDEIEGFKSQLI